MLGTMVDNHSVRVLSKKLDGTWKIIISHHATEFLRPDGIWGSEQWKAT